MKKLILLLGILLIGCSHNNTQYCECEWVDYELINREWVEVNSRTLIEECDGEPSFEVFYRGETRRTQINCE
jgi:hypothetical protein